VTLGLFFKTGKISFTRGDNRGLKPTDKSEPSQKNGCCGTTPIIPQLAQAIEQWTENPRVAVARQAMLMAIAGFALVWVTP
jgi:hypothetical protein